MILRLLGAVESMSLFFTWQPRRLVWIRYRLDLGLLQFRLERCFLKAKYRVTFIMMNYLFKNVSFQNMRFCGVAGRCCRFCSHAPASPGSPGRLLLSSLWLPACGHLFFSQPPGGQNAWRGARSASHLSFFI